jgi:hypothetical protein
MQGRYVFLGKKAGKSEARRKQMEYVIGVTLGFAVAGFATVVGFDREGAFCPTVLIVIAAYHVLFAVMGAPARTLGIETVIAGVFI